MSAAPARRAAYHILLDVERGKADLAQALAATRAHLGDPRDQALAARIAIGALRWQAALDYVIERHARRPIDAIDEEVLAVLRLTTYQLVHLGRVPPSAAVADGVDLVREARKTSATTFANAVLRGLARDRQRLALPQRPDAAVDDNERRTAALLDYFSITLSHPRWLAARWLARYGEAATEAWLRFNNGQAPLTLRANPLRITASELAVRLHQHGVTTTRTRYAPHGLVVRSGNPLGTPPDREGLFVLQDEASQLAGLMLPVKAGDRVLDACASPGGKTTELAAEMGDRGIIVATDLRSRRVALRRETVRRVGANSVRIAQADFTRTPPFGPVFDAVLLDAPCSGLGTLRRNPDIKWRRTADHLAALADAELEMLRNAADAVRAGGALVYATCSSEPEEDEEVVRRFLEERPDFAASGVVPTALVPPSGMPSPVDSAGDLRTYPFDHGLEAFFAALLRRRGW